MRTSVATGNSPSRLEGGQIALSLARRHHRDDFRPFDQKVVQLVVDLVKAMAQFYEIGRSREHGVFALGAHSTRVATGRNQRKR